MRPRLLVATVLTLAVAACGGDDRPRGTPAVSEDPGGGNATYCAIDALEGPESAAVERFNRAHRGEGFTARFETLGDYVRYPDVCDVALIDAAWIGYHVEAGAIADVTERVEERKGDFFGATLGLARYDERYWGFPRHVDVGFLFYKQAAGTPPLTWREAYALGRGGNGLVYSGARDPELALLFLEVAYAAGGEVVSEGGESVLDSPENLRALKLMRRGIARGAVPRSVLRMDRHAARVAFARGATVLRDWAFGYRALRLAHWRSGDEIIEVPMFGDDGTATPVLTGLSVTIAEDAKTEPAALALAEYLTGREEAVRLAKRHRLPTALSATYQDAVVLDWLPYSMELERTLEAGRAHPITPRWPEMAEAIAARVHDALAGRMTPRAALAAADGDVTALLRG